MRRSVSILVIVIVAAVVILTLRPLSFRWKISSFQRQLQQVTNANELQEWAVAELNSANGRRVELTNVPDMLVAPTDGPPNFLVVNGDAEHPHVIARWGGGFGHWGLVLGDAELPAPNDGDYYVQWKPGIYFWHEVQ